MATTVVTVRWSTPPPSSVDERLVVSDDGRARLAAVRPRRQPDRIGVFEGEVTGDEVVALSGAGPEVLIDLTVSDPEVATIAGLAGQIADRLRGTPRAAAQFLAQPLADSGTGQANLALVVIGHGSDPVEFELDAGACAVHFSAAGSSVTWAPLPELPMGFMTADAEGLGGVRQRATVRPGVLGAIAFELPRPADADSVELQVVGSWFLAPNGEPEEFEARTPRVRLG